MEALGRSPDRSMLRSESLRLTWATGGATDAPAICDTFWACPREKEIFSKVPGKATAEEIGSAIPFGFSWFELKKQICMVWLEGSKLTAVSSCF